MDIQPIAIQIAKLRFFISLICDQRTNKDKTQNCGVRPLPNLETRFVAANTLISLDRGSGQQMSLTDPRLPKLEKELAVVRHKHFAAQRRRNKLALQKRDNEIRIDIAGVLSDGGLSDEASHRLAAWDPYDQNAFAPFFDPEWMFGIIDGFDIVIGNPPYVRIQTLAGVAPTLVSYLKAKYTAVTKGSYDIYVVFVERGLSLLRKGGELAYILPNKLLNVDYGKGLRTLIARGQHLDQVVDFGAEQVFPGATNYVCLLFLAKRPVDVCKFLNVASINDWYETGAGTAGQLALEDINGSEWLFVDSTVGELIAKLDRAGKPLLDLPVDMSRGSSSGCDSAFFVNQTIVDIEPEVLRIPVSARDFCRYNYEQPDINRIIFPYDCNGGKFRLLAENVFKRNFPKAYRYLLKMQETLYRRKQYTEWYAFSAPRNLMLHMNAEILVPLLANSGSFTLIPSAVRGRLCPMASGGFTLTLQATTPVCSKYLLGLLNSKLLFWRLRQKSNVFRGGWITCTKQYFGQLPIVIPDNSQQVQHDAIVTLVEQCLAAKSMDPQSDILMLEREIDQIVYQLYNLTSNEIAIVEGKDT